MTTPAVREAIVDVPLDIVSLWLRSRFAGQVLLQLNAMVTMPTPVDLRIVRIATDASYAHSHLAKDVKRQPECVAFCCESVEFEPVGPQEKRPRWRVIVRGGE